MFDHVFLSKIKLNDPKRPMQKNSSFQDIGTNNLQWKLFIKKKNSHDCNSDGKTIFMQPQRDRMEIKIFEFGEKPG